MRQVSPKVAPGILLTTLLVLSAVSADAETYVVDWRGGADFETIQGGLDAATDGDSVLVASGTYTGLHNTDLDFNGKRILLSAISPGETTIDCEGAARGFVFGAGEDSLAVVDGFNVTNGTAEDGGGALIEGSSPSFTNCYFGMCVATDKGGGVSVVGGDPVFDSCEFDRNDATYGGGLAIEGGSVSLRGCLFSLNEAEESGGGLLLVDSTCNAYSCTFSYNECPCAHYGVLNYGGGVRVVGSNAGFYDCDFESNEATHGGALSLRRPSIVDIQGSRFIDNSSCGHGAAVHMYGCSPTISDCLFTGNAPFEGGTVWGEYSSPVLSYCTFWDNKGNYTDDTGHDLELYHTDIGDAVIQNCTFCGWRMNSREGTTLLRFGDCEPLIERSIIAFFNNGAGIACTDSGQPTIRECVVFGNVDGDEVCGDDPYNNLHDDPLFCGFWTGDLTLCANSPCLPEGNSWHTQIGASGVGCGDCDTPVKATSWGTIKAMFR